MAEDTEKTAAQERVTRLSLLFVTSLGIQFVVGMLPLPYTYAGLPAALASIVIGIFLFVAVVGGGSFLLTLLTGFGVVSSGFFALQLTGMALMHGPTVAAQECTARAVTRAAEQVCIEQFEADVVEAAEAWPEPYAQLLINQFGVDEPGSSPSPSPTPSGSPIPSASASATA